MRGAEVGIDRWLFYFEGRAVGGEAGDAHAAVRYLEGAAPDVEREIVREIRQALPGELSAEVDIRFAAGSVIWFGMVSVTSAGSGLGTRVESESFALMLEKLVCYAIDHVVQEYASHFGFYGFRTRPRGAPHVHQASAAAQSTPASDLAAIEARLEALRRSVRWLTMGVMALVAGAIALALGLGWLALA